MRELTARVALTLSRAEHGELGLDVPFPLAFEPLERLARHLSHERSEVDRERPPGESIGLLNRARARLVRALEHARSVANPRRLGYRSRTLRAPRKGEG